MRVITLSKTKELLGIESTIYDTQINAKIPIIDAKVKQVTGNRYNDAVLGDIELGNQLIRLYSIASVNDEDTLRTNRNYRYSQDSIGINNPYAYDSLKDFLEVGQLISGTGIPDNAYIEEVFYDGLVYDVLTVKISEVPTETTGSAEIYLGINIAYQDTIAKGIQFLMNGTSQTLPQNSVESKRIGPVSKSYSSADSKIDNRFGMPAWFVKAFPKYMRGY